VKSSVPPLLSIVAATFVGVYARVAAQPTTAPQPGAPVWSVPRTPWGTPDLQGIWNYGTMTPLERPPQWAGKAVLTPAEAEAYEKQTVERRGDNTAVTAGPDWWELENNVLKNRRTSLIVDPVDGRLPSTTAEYQARTAAGRGRGRGGAPLQDPENLALQDRCIAWPAASPPYQPTVYNNNIQIVQTVNHIVLLSEMIHTARIVRMDGSPHGALRSWYGDSRGRWDGNTLVVDTINFNGRLNFRGTGQDLHLIERFTRTGAGTLEYHYTIDDSSVWTNPWTVRLDMTRIQGPVHEFACHEGNAISMVGALKGARLVEQEATGSPSPR
jgi:hypothetical protein